MDRSNPKLNTRVTFAIAQDKPVGVVIAAYTARLSQVFHWDLETDTFTPGQFLKARAYVLSISPDGKYFGYYVHAFHKRQQIYACIAKVAHFSALGFFPYFLWDMPIIHFLDNGDIFVVNKEITFPWANQFELAEEHITPGFTHRIMRDWKDRTPKLADRILERLKTHMLRWQRCHGTHRDRRIWTTNNELHATDRVTGKPIILKEFPKEPFQEIEPPDWAKKW